MSGWAQAAPVSWAVNADGNWETASNWSSNPIVPNAADDVTIDVGGATVRTITVGAAVPNINGLVSQENLVLSGGNLNIGAGGGQINGTLSISPNRGLRVQQGTFAVNGAINMNSANLDIGSGGTLSLPTLNSYSSTVNPAWQAAGTGSVLTANALTTIDATAGYLQTYATDGGDLNFNGLTTINAANGYYVRFHTDGAGSSVSIPNLTSIQAVALEVWNSGTMTTGQITSAPLSTIDVRNAAPNFNAVANVNGSNLNVFSAGTLNLPAVTTLTSSNNPGWQVDGVGSTLSLNAVATMNATAGYLQVYVTNGGQLNLNSLTTLNAANGYYVRFRSDGVGSSVSISNLTSVQGVIVEVWNSGAMTTGQLTSATQSTIDVRNATPNFNALTNINGSNLYSAGTLNLPALTSVTSTGNPYWQVDGAVGTLTANALTTINATAGYLQVYVTNGGQLNLNSLTTLNAANGFYVRFRSDGVGSSVSISNLTSVQGAIVEVWNSGAMTTGQLTSATQSTIDVHNATPNFNALTNINGTNLFATTAGTLTLPALTSVTSTGNPTWQANGAGSTVSLNALTTINASAGYVQVVAGDSGHVNLNALTQINGASGFYVRLAPTNAGSRIEAPALTSITGGLIEPRDNGVVKLPAGMVTATQSTISTATGGKVEVGTLVLQTGSVLFGDGNGIGNVVNTAGRVAPGLSPGILTLPGTYSQGSAGTLAMEVGGAVFGTDTDRLVVGGAASFNGKLEVTLPNMFATTLGTTYDIVTASAVSGSFSVSTGRLVNPQVFLGIQYLADRVRLKAANAGDVNLDGIVNIFDINQVSSTWNTGSPSGDANTDGTVNIFDINLISSNWGAHPGSATPVPEPSTLVLLALGAVSIAGLRRRF